MPSVLQRYARWLHTGWPSGTVEKLPEVRDDGSTNVPGLYVVGDLTGIPLLKLSADSGARAVRTIAADPEFTKHRSLEDQQGRRVRELVVIGAGVGGMSAALEARNQEIDCVVLEASEPFSTIVNFPRAKPIYTYPTEMKPAGSMQFTADVKEDLVRELRAQTIDAGIIPHPGRCTRVQRSGGVLAVELADQEPVLALRVIVAIGRSGDFRSLNVPGEDLDKVYNRLHDPAEYTGQRALVVGGGDSALETAIALAEAGVDTSFSYRRPSFSRPKPENADRFERLRANPDVPLRAIMQSEVQEIADGEVKLSTTQGEERLRNDVVFTMLGREAPLDFFRRSGVSIRGEWTRATKLGLVALLAFAVFVYHWKTDSGLPIYTWFKNQQWFPFQIGDPSNPASLWGTLKLSLQGPSFYYSLAYSLAVSWFGYKRIQRRRTPYVKAQTITLTAIQVLPLFLLPYVLLPWMGHNGWFDSGLGRTLADGLFPISQWDVQGREYWRSVGLILAWPLMFWNIFTDQPLTWWLVIGFIQTFVIIPIMVYRWGKGAYCGWVCSCGALAETVGDTLRHKMPHGPRANRWNLVGQVVMVAAFVLLALRVVSWVAPESVVGGWAKSAYMVSLLGRDANWASLAFPFRFLNYTWIVDVTMAGILGVGLYYHFSGRVWCRFGCPLAALMHVYARFSRFRILADKKKCISCNVCTSVCHQGIDVMSFANKGMPMEDVQCVRCSACVQSCPTGVLEFGTIDPKTGAITSRDALDASPVQMRE